MYSVQICLMQILFCFAKEILERRGVSKASKPKEGARCVSCLLNDPGDLLFFKNLGSPLELTFLGVGDDCHVNPSIFVRFASNLLALVLFTPSWLVRHCESVN